MTDQPEPASRDRIFMIVSALAFVAMILGVVVELVADVSVWWILATAAVGLVIVVGSPIVAGLTDPDDFEEADSD